MADSIVTTKQGQFADTRRDFMVDGGWVSGCDTLLFPTDIAQGTYAWGVNITNRGGIINTRPTRQRMFSVPGSIAQGFFSFLTLGQVQYLVWAIDGVIYYSVYPFSSYSPIMGINFSATAPKVYFQDSVAAATYNPDGTISLLPTPINYLFIQDGISRPAWWDGITAYQPPLTPTFSPVSGLTSFTGVPIGTAMASSGGRLWISVDRLVFASDYVIPTQFQEQSYLAEASGFQFPRNVTTLLPAPINSGLFVFTDRGIYTLQSNIVDRTTWQSTPNFQQAVTEEIGCIAPFSAIYQHGLPWFYSARGFISMDLALQLHITNVLYTRDGEMRRSKAKLSPDLTRVCAGLFENILMVGVPHASQFNRHTWIMDGGIAPKLNSSAGLCWTGIWTGTYPVQFATIIHSGVEENYELSYANGYMAQGGFKYPISIWRNFLTIQNDDGVTPIRCQWESRMFRMPNDEMMQACFIELLVTQLSGIATVNFHIGGIAGLYTLLSTSTLRADTGPFFNAQMMTIYYGFPGFSDTIIQSYRPQNRYPRSPEINIASSTGTSHFIEVGRTDFIDKGFQILITWTGNMAIRGIKFYYRPFSIQASGQVPVDESDIPHIVLDAQ